MRALIGKEWDPMNWNGDVWEDPEEAEDVEFLDANEIFCLRKRFRHLLWQRDHCLYPLPC